MRYELSNGKDRVYQWDHDIVLTILEPENVPTVHFRWGGKAVPLTVTNQQVEIPPELMQLPHEIILWAYMPNHTMDMARIPLEKRPKPSDYAYTPTEIKTWEALDERIKSLEDGGGIAGVSSVNGQTGNVTITAEGLGALTKDDLQEATDKALAQAKESGEFDGAQGPKGDTGETGETGPQGPAGPAGAGLDVTGATVGQTVKISAVDDNGVPTAWVPADLASGDEEYELIFTDTVTEDAAGYLRDTDVNGNAFALKKAVVIIFTPPYEESDTAYSRQLSFDPKAFWSSGKVTALSDAIKSSAAATGCYDVVWAEVIFGHQVCTRKWVSNNTTNVFGMMTEKTGSGLTGFQFFTDTAKLMESNNPVGNMTCVKIMGYKDPIVAKNTQIAVYGVRA